MPMPFGAAPTFIDLFSLSSIQNRFNHVSDPRVMVSQWRERLPRFKSSNVIAASCSSLLTAKPQWNACRGDVTMIGR